MKVSVDYSKNISCYKNNSNLSFARKQVLQTPCVNKTIKKTIPFALAMMFVGLMSASCGKTSSRHSEKYDYDGIKVELSEVQPSTKDSVLMPIFDLKSKLNESNDFLKNLKINVLRSFRAIEDENDTFQKHLRENYSASYVKGMSFYSDNKLEKRIAIQERAHKLNDSISKVDAMQQTLMHEVGHQFDNHFGHDHNSDIAQKWDSLQHSKSLSEDETQYSFCSYTNEEQQIDYEYNAQNELSDRWEFKEAFIKDLMIIQDLYKNSPESLPKNINYYVADVDFSMPITPDIIDYVDLRTDVVYANTFSYIMGTDEGDKEAFLNAFPNCKKMVEDDIAKYLNIRK